MQTLLHRAWSFMLSDQQLLLKTVGTIAIFVATVGGRWLAIRLFEHWRMMVRKLNEQTPVILAGAFRQSDNDAPHRIEFAKLGSFRTVLLEKQIYNTVTNWKGESAVVCPSKPALARWVSAHLDELLPGFIQDAHHVSSFMEKETVHGSNTEFPYIEFVLAFVRFDPRETGWFDSPTALLVGKRALEIIHRGGVLPHNDQPYSRMWLRALEDLARRVYDDRDLSGLEIVKVNYRPSARKGFTQS